MDYTALKSSAADWLARSDITDPTLSVMVQLAEARIYRRLRIVDMESIFFSPLDADGKVAVPTDYLAFKEFGLYEGGGNTATFSAFASASRIARIQRTTGEVLLDQITSNRGSVPQRMARIGSNFVVAPQPSGAYSLGGIYYARPAALSSTNPTNSLLTNNPDLYLWAVSLEAALYIKDTAAAELFKDRLEGVLGEMQDADDREQLSGTQSITSIGVGAV